MTVIGATKEFAAAVLDGNERLCYTTGTAANPRRALVGGVIQALVRACNYLIPVIKQVAELPTVASTVAGYP